MCIYQKKKKKKKFNYSLRVSFTRELPSFFFFAKLVHFDAYFLHCSTRKKNKKKTKQANKSKERRRRRKKKHSYTYAYTRIFVRAPRNNQKKKKQ